MSNMMQCGDGEPVMDPESDAEFLPSRILLIDRSAQLVDEWRRVFAGIGAVEVIAGDYFQRPADAIVSPANSFGIMDGGIDHAIRDRLGHIVQSRIQKVIVDKYHGELPVGCAEIVETNEPHWKYLIVAPTMRVPEPVAFTLNAYLAFRAILLAVENFNKNCGRREIDSLVCCGLGTGVGKVSPTKCAQQMRAAYQVMTEFSRILSFEAIHEIHRALQLI